GVSLPVFVDPNAVHVVTRSSFTAVPQVEEQQCGQHAEPQCPFGYKVNHHTIILGQLKQVRDLLDPDGVGCVDQPRRGKHRSHPGVVGGAQPLKPRCSQSDQLVDLFGGALVQPFPEHLACVQRGLQQPGNQLG